MAGHWPLIVRMVIIVDKGKDRNQVHHWLTSMRIKNNIRQKINNFTAIQKLQQAKQALRSSTQS
jgi:acetylglutamate kinase